MGKLNVLARVSVDLALNLESLIQKYDKRRIVFSGRKTTLLMSISTNFK